MSAVQEQLYVNNITVPVATEVPIHSNVLANPSMYIYHPGVDNSPAV